MKKQCGKCKETKPFTAFAKSQANSDGYQNYCKACKKEHNDKKNPRTNKLRCFAGPLYIKKSNPFFVPGKRFKSLYDMYAYWTKKSGVDFTYLAEQEEAKITKGYVYVIYNPAWDGWYKVGKAEDIEARLRGYQTGDPHRSYKVCYELEFDNCHDAERVIHNLLQEDDKVLKKNEWVMASFDRIRNIINEVKRNERASSGHRNGQQSELDLVLCN